MKIDNKFTSSVLKELEGGLVAPDGTIQGAPTAKQVKKTKDELEDDDEQRYESVNELKLKKKKSAELTYGQAMSTQKLDHAIKDHIEDNYPEDYNPGVSRHHGGRGPVGMTGKQGHSLSTTHIMKLAKFAKKNGDNKLTKLIDKWVKTAKANDIIESVNEANFPTEYIGPFVISQRMSVKDLKKLHDAAVEGYAYWQKGFRYPKRDYKAAYTYIEKILKNLGEAKDPFKPEYGTGEVVHDCPKHVEVEGVKGKVVGHTLNEQGDVNYIDIDFGTGKVYENVPSSNVKVLEGQSHQHEIKEEPTSKVLTKDQLAEIIQEEIKSLDEISGFPDMKKWWKEDPKDVMSFVYWLQRKTPPTGSKWDKAWKEIATQLNKRHKAPSSDFEKIIGEAWGGEATIKGTYAGRPVVINKKGRDMSKWTVTFTKTKKTVPIEDVIANLKDDKGRRFSESVNEASIGKFSLVKVKRGEHKGEEGRIMVFGGPRKHSVVALDYGEYNFNPKDLELAESLNRSTLKSIIKEEFLNILKEASGGEIFAQYKDTIRKMEAELLNRMDKGGVPEDLEQDVIAILVRQLSKRNSKISCR